MNIEIVKHAAELIDLVIKTGDTERMISIALGDCAVLYDKDFIGVTRVITIPSDGDSYLGDSVLMPEFNRLLKSNSYIVSQEDFDAVVLEAARADKLALRVKDAEDTINHNLGYKRQPFGYMQQGDGKYALFAKES